MNKLLQSYRLGDIGLANRIVMAPLTRSRANSQGVHSELAMIYYRQRAGAGLIITEATAISKQGSGYVNIPGIWNDAQVKAWQDVTYAVHDAGGKIFMQLFHTGRVGHSSLYGEQPVSSTTKAPPGTVMAADFSMQPYEAPRMLGAEEIPGIVAQFRNGAENALRAGFDGIEIHAANGYILDQFLRGGVNERTDDYGGSLENRVRLLKEVVEAAVEVWGPGRVGVRFSPYNGSNGMSDPDPVETFTYAAKEMNEFPLAYIHITEMGAPEPAKITREIRKVYKGVIIINGGLDKERGEELLQDNTADLVCYGMPFISNPDLVERFRSDLPLAAADKATLYTPGPVGYTDYPVAKEAA